MGDTSINISDPKAVFDALTTHMTKDDMRVLGRALLMWVDKIQPSTDDFEWATQVADKYMKEKKADG